MQKFPIVTVVAWISFGLYPHLCKLEQQEHHHHHHQQQLPSPTEFLKICNSNIWHQKSHYLMNIQFFPRRRDGICCCCCCCWFFTFCNFTLALLGSWWRMIFFRNNILKWFSWQTDGDGGADRVLGHAVTWNFWERAGGSGGAKVSAMTELSALSWRYPCRTEVFIVLHEAGGKDIPATIK